jgi:hypothetical protein
MAHSGDRAGRGSGRPTPSGCVPTAPDNASERPDSLTPPMHQRRSSRMGSFVSASSSSRPSASLSGLRWRAEWSWRPACRATSSGARGSASRTPTDVAPRSERSRAPRRTGSPVLWTTEPATWSRRIQRVRRSRRRQDTDASPGLHPGIHSVCGLGRAVRVEPARGAGYRSLPSSAHNGTSEYGHRVREHADDHMGDDVATELVQSSTSTGIRAPNCCR